MMSQIRLTKTLKKLKFREVQYNAEARSSNQALSWICPGGKAAASVRPRTEVLSLATAVPPLTAIGLVTLYPQGLIPLPRTREIAKKLQGHSGTETPWEEGSRAPQSSRAHAVC